MSLDRHEATTELMRHGVSAEVAEPVGVAVDLLEQSNVDYWVGLPGVDTDDEGKETPVDVAVSNSKGVEVAKAKKKR